MKTTTIQAGNSSLLGLSIAFIYWVVDSLFDVYLFNLSTDFFNSFFTTNAHELWMRISIVTLIIIFSLYTHKIKHELLLKSDEVEELKYLETTDPLTSLFNKRKLYELLEYEMEKEKRYKTGLSVIFCSIDNFKNINSTHKQDTIDNLLRTVALQLAICLRKSDIISRWADEEFLILIPNKIVDKTTMIAEKIRNAIENYNFEGIGNITTSLGVTQYIDNDNKVTIVNRANDALKKAIEKKGNHVEIIA